MITGGPSPPAGATAVTIVWTRTGHVTFTLPAVPLGAAPDYPVLQSTYNNIANAGGRVLSVDWIGGIPTPAPQIPFQPVLAPLLERGVEVLRSQGFQAPVQRVGGFPPPRDETLLLVEQFSNPAAPGGYPQGGPGGGARRLQRQPFIVEPVVPEPQPSPGPLPIPAPQPQPQPDVLPFPQTLNDLYRLERQFLDLFRRQPQPQPTGADFERELRPDQLRPDQRSTEVQEWVRDWTRFKVEDPPGQPPVLVDTGATPGQPPVLVDTGATASNICPHCGGEQEVAINAKTGAALAEAAHTHVPGLPDR